MAVYILRHLMEATCTILGVLYGVVMFCMRCITSGVLHQQKLDWGSLLALVRMLDGA